MSRGIRRQYIYPVRQPDTGCPTFTRLQDLRRHLDEHGVLGNENKEHYLDAAKRAKQAATFIK